MRRIANCLRNLTRKLSAALNSPAKKARKPKKLISATSRDLKAYEPFLLDVLEATGDSNGDEQVVYPLLATNTDKLNDIFAEVLWNWATNTLPKVKPDVAKSMAGVIGNFSGLISQFPLGNKASNIEIAITGYKTVLTIFTHTAFPQEWVMTQNNLGAAYSKRILGEQAENIEMAIAAYTAALEVSTRRAFPDDWAMTQSNLGNTYLYRIRGNKAENLELAITAYTAALEVYTRTVFPYEHIQSLFMLGIVYQEANQFDLAYSQLATSIKTVESLRGEIISDDQAKRKQAEAWNKLYRRMVEVCLKLATLRKRLNTLSVVKPAT